ncbi:MAG: class I SAM-dependent methyltransferase [Gemmatimonadales bacterium]
MRGIEQVPWLYDRFAAIGDRGLMGRWRDWLVGAAESPVLEVGAGTGRNLPRYPSGVLVIGTDPDRLVLRTARRRAPRVPLVAARAEALPFRDRSFATVVSTLVFCSVADPARGLREVGRVLRPGGALRMIEHVRARARWLGRVQDAITPVWNVVVGGCHPNRDTEQTVRDAGFTIASTEYQAHGVLRRFAARRESEHVA